MRLVLFAVLSFVPHAHVMLMFFYTNFALRSLPLSILVGDIDVSVLFSVVLTVKILTLPGILVVFIPVVVLRS